MTSAPDALTDETWLLANLKYDADACFEHLGSRDPFTTDALRMARIVKRIIDERDALRERAEATERKLVLSQPLYSRRELETRLTVAEGDLTEA